MVGDRGFFQALKSRLVAGFFVFCEVLLSYGCLYESIVIAGGLS